MLNQNHKKFKSLKLQKNRKKKNNNKSKLFLKQVLVRNKLNNPVLHSP